MIDRIHNGADLSSDVDKDLEVTRLHALIDGVAAHLVYESADVDP